VFYPIDAPGAVADDLPVKLVALAIVMAAAVVGGAVVYASRSHHTNHCVKLHHGAVKGDSTYDPYGSRPAYDTLVCR
jgi:hypothetical protein